MKRSYAPDPERRMIFRLYRSVLIEQGLSILTGMISTIMVSGVGDFAVSGVNLVDQINFMVISIFNAISAGATIVMAQYIGGKRFPEAAKTANQSILLCILASTVLGVFTAGAARPILQLLYGNASRNVLDACHIYFVFSGISYPLVGLYTVSAGIMRAAGNTRSPMIVSIFANIINIVAAIIFILGARLGILGFSLAMLLSRITSGVLSLFLAKKSVGGTLLPKFSFRFDLPVLKPVFGVGVPSGIDSFVFQGARIFVSVLLSTMGTVAMHANAITNSLLGIINLPGNAFMVVCVTMVGQAYGARQLKKAKKLMFRLCGYTAISHVILLIPFFLLMDTLIGLYNPADVTVPLVRQLLTYACIFTVFFWSFSFVLPQGLRSVGDAKATMYISVVSILLLRVAGSWFFASFLGWGVPGLWIGMFLDWIGRSAGYIVRAAFDMWNRRLKPTDEMLPDN
jgi:putative MATE family efflux protein